MSDGTKIQERNIDMVPSTRRNPYWQIYLADWGIWKGKAVD